MSAETRIARWPESPTTVTARAAATDDFTPSPATAQNASPPTCVPVASMLVIRATTSGFACSPAA
jgi:hypothetical protein